MSEHTSLNVYLNTEQRDRLYYLAAKYGFTRIVSGRATPNISALIQWLIEQPRIEALMPDPDQAANGRLD